MFAFAYFCIKFLLESHCRTESLVLVFVFHFKPNSFEAYLKMNTDSLSKWHTPPDGCEDMPVVYKYFASCILPAALLHENLIYSILHTDWTMWPWKNMNLSFDSWFAKSFLGRNFKHKFIYNIIVHPKDSLRQRNLKSLATENQGNSKVSKRSV